MERFKTMNNWDVYSYGGIGAMYRKVYWGQIFSRKTTWRVKWIAIQSLWIIRGWK
jgi:hypothetical protein